MSTTPTPTPTSTASTSPASAEAATSPTGSRRAASPLRILCIIDPPHLLNPRLDTSLAILDEAAGRGHETFVCELNDLALREGQALAHARRTVAFSRERPPAIRVAETAQLLPLSHFHAVLMRKDPPYDEAYHLATLILEYARGQTFLMNDPRGLREANEKLYIFHFQDLLAPTIVTRRIDELRAFMREQGGAMVVKPLDGFGGSAVFQVSESDRNTTSILELMTKSGTKWVMAQKLLDIANLGDKRILLLNGEPICALLRMPGKAELRSNLASGGTGLQTALTDRDRHIIARLKPRLEQDGLYFVGLDVIGEHLTEVNVTSPTGVQYMDRLYGVRLEAKLVDFIEERAPRAL